MVMTILYTESTKNPDATLDSGNAWLQTNTSKERQAYRDCYELIQNT